MQALLSPPANLLGHDHSRSQLTQYVLQTHVAQRGVAERGLWVDLMVLANTYPGGPHHPTRLEVVENRAHPSLGDAERVRDLPDGGIRVRGNVEKYMTVARQQSPLFTHGKHTPSCCSRTSKAP